MYYRVAGLRQSPNGGVEITNRVIAKLSRTEVAIKFMHYMGANTLKALKEEVDILKDISTAPNCHPGIVCYHGLFKSKGYEYILIMEKN